MWCPSQHACHSYDTSQSLLFQHHNCYLVVPQYQPIVHVAILSQDFFNCSSQIQTFPIPLEPTPSLCFLHGMLIMECPRGLQDVHGTMLTTMICTRNLSKHSFFGFVGKVAFANSYNKRKTSSSSQPIMTTLVCGFKHADRKKEKEEWIQQVPQLDP